MNMTLTDFKILSMLIEEDMYGLEIVDKASKGGTDILLGSLYNILRKLENNGLVKSYWGSDLNERGGNRRRYYKITGEGRMIHEQEINAVIQLNSKLVWNF